MKAGLDFQKEEMNKLKIHRDLLAEQFKSQLKQEQEE
jgi:hypothetical protein